MLREDEGKGKQSALPENARVELAQMLKEGLGDHILLLRLYQVGRLSCVCCACIK